MEKKIILNNDIEANLMTLLLSEQNIDHVLISYHDSAMDGLWQSQKGWGFIGVEGSDEQIVIDLLLDLRKNNSEN